MTTYYVSTTGNDSNPGTQGQPFQTIYKGISISVDGDIVKVLPGTYYPTFSTRPVINKSISLIGSGRSNTIIDGSNIKSKWTTDWQQGLVEIQNGNSYFGNFTVQNVLPNTSGSNIGQGAAGIAIYCGPYGGGSSISNIIVEKNYVNNIWSSGIQVIGDYATNPVKNITIRYNELYKICYGGNPNKQRVECLAIRFADTFYIYYNYVHKGGYTPSGMIQYGAEGIILADSTNDGKVYNNYVADVHSVGFYVGYTNHELYNNIAEKIYSFQSQSVPGDGFDITIEEGPAIFSGINFHDNVSYDNWSGFGVCNYHDEGTPPGTISNIIIDSNIVYRPDVNINIGPQDIYVQNCGNNLSGILIKNNYANNIIIDSGKMPNGNTVDSAVTLSGNDTNITDIVNQFNSIYPNLKSDILNHVTGTTTENLLANPVFEISLPANWSKYSLGTVPPNPFIYPDIGMNNTKCVAIDFGTTSYSGKSCWTQTIDINPSNQYSIYGYMKLTNVIPASSGSGAAIIVNWNTSTNSYISSSIITTNVGTIDWTNYSSNVTSPSNAYKATILLQLQNSSGKVYFDDIFFGNQI